MSDKCPTCESPDRAKHPAMQHEGEVQPCRDPWHQGINPGPGKNTRLQRWVDPAMFQSEPLNADAGPQVYLLAAPADPLGSIAAMCAMYEGRVVRHLGEVADDDRRRYLAEMQKTKLTTPLESVQLHFMIEGVTRSFTHQMVRQRTAAYAQESMRFAVVEDGFAERVALPPYLAGVSLEGTGYEHWLRGDTARPHDPEVYARLTNEQKSLVDWYFALKTMEAAYGSAVNRGMPAEDARGLLPHNMTTRLHYVTNLRGLLDHAGNRLCTQAQFEWRLVFARIASALRLYGRLRHYDAHLDTAGGWRRYNSGWQYEAIADLLRPVCYQKGSCAFGADFDRKCSIRNRVQANADVGRPSAEWGQELDLVTGDPMVAGFGPRSVVRDERDRPVFIGSINPAEWAADPGAAR